MRFSHVKMCGKATPNLKNIKNHSKSTKPIKKLRHQVLRLRLRCEGINLYLNYSHLKIVDDGYMMNINMRDTLQWYIRTKWIRIAGYLNLDNTYVKPGTKKIIFKQRSWSQIINACGGPEPHKIGAYFTQEEAKLFLKYCQQDRDFITNRLMTKISQNDEFCGMWRQIELLLSLCKQFYKRKKTVALQQFHDHKYRNRWFYKNYVEETKKHINEWKQQHEDEKKKREQDAYVEQYRIE